VRLLLWPSVVCRLALFVEFDTSDQQEAAGEKLEAVVLQLSDVGAVHSARSLHGKRSLTLIMRPKHAKEV
jgi:hypothetical protein